jgi:hypothetical protein
MAEVTEIITASNCIFLDMSFSMSGISNYVHNYTKYTLDV